MARLLGLHPSGKPILRTIDLYCRDGDPHCDRDGACDGTCTVAFCPTDGNYIGGCPFLGGGFCPASVDETTEPIAVGTQSGEGTQYDGNNNLATKFTIHCLNAAPKCDYSLPGDSVDHCCVRNR